VRFAFWLPDLGKPTGGLVAAYRFARYLHEDGHDVLLVRETTGGSGGVNAAYSAGFEVSSLKRLVATGDPDRILVVPEILTSHGALSESRNPLIVLNQNPYFTGRADLADRIYTGPRTLGVISTSEYTTAYLTLRYPGTRIERVIYGVNLDLFRVRPRSSNRRVIAWMPRKRRDDADLVIDVLGADSYLRETGWVFDAIDGVSEAEVGERLGTADIFLAFSEREGFGLPLAEAMASGAVCVGFTGVGGSELLTVATGWPVAESDIVEYVRTVLDVSGLIDAGDPIVAMRTRSARRLIEQNYTRTIERESTVRAFAALVD
jgi:hypothetical protein